MRWSAAIAALTLAACSSPARVVVFEGAHWQVDVVTPDVSLRGLCVVDARVVWASGSRGTVLRSIDGGGSWQQVGPGDAAALDFRDVAAFDAERAVICTTTEPARVYATADGGRTWRIAFADSRKGAFFDALAFFGDRRGLLLGDPMAGCLQLFATGDGGDSWRPLPPAALPIASDGEAAFAASGTCLSTYGSGNAWIATGGRRSRCWRSDDGGGTWVASELPIAAGRESSGAFSLAFFDRSHGVAVGGDYRDPEATAATAAVTSDGGATWTAGAAHGYRSAVCCLGDGRSCLAVGETGASVSGDGGRTWQVFGSDGFHAVACAGDTVIAVGAGGRIGRLTVHGATR